MRVYLVVLIDVRIVEDDAKTVKKYKGNGTQEMV